MGYPLIGLLGQEQKATFGRVNSLSGPLGDFRFIQIDVPIQPGNSGGPLLNKHGQAIGVVVATLNQLEAWKAGGTIPQNVNYAIKSDYALPLIEASVSSQGKTKIDKNFEMDYSGLIKYLEKSVILVLAR